MASDIYLFFKEPNVAGDSEDAENSNAIEIFSFADGSAMPVTEGRSFAGAGTSGIAHFNEFSFTKMTDSASVPLMKHCWEGTHFKEVKVKCYRSTGNNQRICYLEITMTGCVITSISFSASMGGLPVESIAIDYSKITYSYRDTDKATGAQKDPMHIYYDRVTNAVG